MLEIENIFESHFANKVFNGNYNFSNASIGIPDNDSEIAIIREFLQGNVANIRLTAREAYSGTSVTLKFANAASDIRNKLTQMEQLADEAANGFHTNSDKASMQKQFEQIATDINNIVDKTEHGNNKLFTANGQTISLPLGNGQNIHLFARDLAIDITGMDLTNDPNAARNAVKTALQDANSYGGYLAGLNKRLNEVMARIENRAAVAAGIQPSDFGLNIAQKITSKLANSVQNQPYISIQTQANIKDDETLSLLKDG